MAGALRPDTLKNLAELIPNLAELGVYLVTDLLMLLFKTAKLFLQTIDTFKVDVLGDDSLGHVITVIYKWPLQRHHLHAPGEVVGLEA